MDEAEKHSSVPFQPGSGRPENRVSSPDGEVIRNPNSGTSDRTAWKLMHPEGKKTRPKDLANCP